MTSGPDVVSMVLKPKVLRHAEAEHVVNQFFPFDINFSGGVRQAPPSGFDFPATLGIRGVPGVEQTGAPGVPEPASMLLWGLLTVSGGVYAGLRRRIKKATP